MAVAVSCHLIPEWYNGTVWTTLENTTNPTTTYTPKLWTLPSGANNNANFQIRFKVTGCGSSRYAYLDEVKITGDPTP